MAATLLLGSVAVRSAYGDDVPRQCPATFTADYSVGYAGKYWGAQTWDKFGQDLAYNQARYTGVGQFLDVTERWEWLDPQVTFVCGKIIVAINPDIWVDIYLSSSSSGTVVPYGREEDEETQDPDGGGTGGGGGGNHPTDEWYICSYWLYPDGSRSGYYQCSPM